MCDLDLWPLTLKINRVRPLVISSKCTKLKVLAGTVQSVSCLQGLTTSCYVWPWPLTLKISRVRPLVISSKCTKFEGPSYNGSVCIVFTSFVDRQTDGQTPAPYHNPTSRAYKKGTTAASERTKLTSVKEADRNRKSVDHVSDSPYSLHISDISVDRYWDNDSSTNGLYLIERRVVRKILTVIVSS